MNKTLAIVLLVVGIGLLLFGYNEYNHSVESINVLGLELSAENEEGTNRAFILMGIGIVLAIGGIVGLVQKK